MVNNIKVIINLPRFIIHLFLFTVFYDQCIDDLLRECKNPPPQIPNILEVLVFDDNS